MTTPGRREGTHRGPASGPSATPASSLSPREVEVLRSAAGGQTNLAVAHALGLSVQTVRNHMSSSYRKLGVQSLVEAMNALGWVSAYDPAASVTMGPSTRWWVRL